MKEFLIYGVELDEYGIPILPPANIIPKETVTFREPFDKKIKNWKAWTGKLEFEAAF